MRADPPATDPGEPARRSGPVGIVVVIGHPRAGSRTHSVAVRTASLFSHALAEHGVPASSPQVVDLAVLAPHLLGRCGSAAPGHDGATDDARQALSRAGLLIVASPTFRASYSGLLKVFLDLLPRDGLAGPVVVPLMTAGIPGHRDRVDSALRPVLLEMRADVPAPGISVLESEIASLEGVFAGWWTAHGQLLGKIVRERWSALAEEVSRC